MRVGVLGGGLQGCCVALSLAERGVDVTLFDRNDQLLSRTAIANEGKVHLGYMYANDPGYSTARLMMQGALAFAPFFTRHLGLANNSMTVSRPAAYVVHRDSQRTPEQVSQYLSTVHSLIREASQGRSDAYFGRDLSDHDPIPGSVPTGGVGGPGWPMGRPPRSAPSVSSKKSCSSDSPDDVIS